MAAIALILTISLSLFPIVSESGESSPSEPVVSLTLASNVSINTYYVDEVTNSGFIIRVREAVGENTQFNWHAFEGIDIETTMSDLAEGGEVAVASDEIDIDEATDSAQIDIDIIYDVMESSGSADIE